MTFQLSRRAVLGAVVFGAAGVLPVWTAVATDAAAELADLERRNGGRLGVAALDTATGRRIGQRVDERFALCSTFKALAAAHVLARVDHGEERLDRRVVFAAGELVPYSPTTGKHVGAPGMTVAEICEAAVTLSDNTAGNLMLQSFGGPAGLTAFLRTLGDPVTRLDRTEPTLNEALPGDPRDTTSPAALVATLERLLIGDALSAGSRTQLIDWLVACKTGQQRLRAGFGPGWRVGDKTGAGANGSANDIAIAWPPGRAPVLTAVYFTESKISDEARGAVIADVGRIVRTAFA